MIIKTISFSAKATLNLTNYNSLSVERRIDAELTKDDDVDKCNSQIRKDVWLLLEKDIYCFNIKLKEVINK